MNGKEKPLDLTVYMGIFLWYTGFSMDTRTKLRCFAFYMMEENLDLS